MEEVQTMIRQTLEQPEEQKINYISARKMPETEQKLMFLEQFQEQKILEN